MAGRVFMGRYETIRLLGEGGMGRVYLARQLDLGRQVVVKVMHEHIAADARFRDRFTRETLLMARFQHPYAVTLYDATLNDPEGPCIVMEHIKGISLDVVLQHNGGRLDPIRVGRILRQLCEVLQAAHNEGIMHRDLKPANLMLVDADTPYEMVKVMDFGLAKLIRSESFNNVTTPNTEFAVGTPGYMCPEQARGEPMDHRGDLYSVGVILYEMLCGQLPFAGRSTMDVLLAHATEDPPPFAHFAVTPRVPPTIERVVLDTLAKDPEERPNSARELAQLYENAVAEDMTTLTEARYDQTGQGPMGPRIKPRSSARVPAPVTGVNPLLDTPTSEIELGAGNSQELMLPLDPATVVHTLEAWMPEVIAAHKLRGFIHDVGGDVLESVPGRIKVRLGGKGSVYLIPGRSSFSWLGLGRRSGLIDMELRLQRAESSRDNLLRIIVLLRPMAGEVGSDASWRQLCNQIYCDLRGYLMGHTGQVANESAGG
jgi:serine/threonine-protein kinase